jgi:hypothetical protein
MAPLSAKKVQAIEAEEMVRQRVREKNLFGLRTLRNVVIMMSVIFVLLFCMFTILEKIDPVQARSHAWQLEAFENELAVNLELCTTMLQADQEALVSRQGARTYLPDFLRYDMLWSSVTGSLHSFAPLSAKRRMELLLAAMRLERASSKLRQLSEARAAATEAQWKAAFKERIAALEDFVGQATDLKKAVSAALDKNPMVQSVRRVGEKK